MDYAHFIDQVDFTGILAAALTPITLISGVGLLLLAMSARYMHTTERVRQSLRARDLQGPTPVLDLQMQMLFRRARLLKRAMEFVVLSAGFSALLVFSCVIEAMFGLHINGIKSSLLVLSVFCIILTTAYFLGELHLSLTALEKSLTKTLRRPLA